MIDRHGPGPDWYVDPGGTYRFRWWDGDRWTTRVVGSGPRIRQAPTNPAWTRPSPVDLVEHHDRARRARRVAIAATAIAVGIATLVLGARVVNEAAEDYNEASIGEGGWQLLLAMEMNDWKLPPSIQAYSGSLFDRSHDTTVTRDYRAAIGSTPELGADDLVHALRGQGYRDLEATGPGEWAGSCSTTDKCRMFIRADPVGSRIVVTLST